MKSEQLKQHIIAIVLGQLLRNITLYEHIYLENIKKLFKSTGKCDNRSQYKAMIEADILSTTEGLNGNITMTVDTLVNMNRHKKFAYSIFGNIGCQTMNCYSQIEVY